MLPPWMIERLEQERREREAQDQPRVEIQPPADERPHPERPRQSSTSVVTVQVW